MCPKVDMSVAHFILKAKCCILVPRGDREGNYFLFCSRLSSLCISISCKAPSSGMASSPGTSTSTVTPEPGSSFGNNLEHVLAISGSTTKKAVDPPPSIIMSPTFSRSTPIETSTFGQGSARPKSTFDTLKTRQYSASAVVTSIPRSGLVRTKRARTELGRPPTRRQATSARSLSFSSISATSAESKNCVTSIPQASEAATACASISLILTAIRRGT
mmetsp:Transcript_18197/g.24144  ORF Transcript_18197/g.24144 Transcript_18197/m.24144 type:complete len:217 (-) Transcript_18197:177-827(-)